MAALQSYKVILARSLASIQLQRSVSYNSRALVQCHDHGLAARQQQQQQPLRPQILRHSCGLLGELQLRCFAQQKKPKSRDGRESGSDSDSDSNSDDEFKDRGKFWLRKMRTFHGLLDVNKDGVIGYDDYKLLASKFTALGHLTPEASKEFQAVMETLWAEQWGEISPYNLISVEKYISEMQHVVHDKSLRKKVHRFLPYLFQAVDKDASGLISLTEFKLLFKCLGLTEQDAVRSFAAIDENNDGNLSIKEFVKLGRDFFLTEDERRVSKQFWGPLVEK